MKILTLRSFLIGLNVIGFVFVSFAQHSFSGVLLDENDNQPIPFASVALKQDGEIIRSTQTYEDGTFYFDQLRDGSYNVFAYFAGSSKEFTDIKINGADQLLSLSMNLANVLDTIVVPGHKGLIQPEDITRYEPDFIENMNAINIVDVEAVSPGAIETSEGISYKGARPGTAVYYIDGVRTYGELYMPMSAVASIDIYNGGVPSKYGNSTSAVIVVESKSFPDDF